MKNTIALLSCLLLIGCSKHDDADQGLVAADTLAVTAPITIDRFLDFEQAHRHAIGMDAQSAARGLRERHGDNLSDLKAIRGMYARNRSEANRTRLQLAMEMVRSEEGVAASYLNGNTLTMARQNGAPFAPPVIQPIPIVVNPVDLTPLSTSLEAKFEAIRQRLDRMNAVLKANGMTNPPAVQPPPGPPGLPQ